MDLDMPQHRRDETDAKVNRLEDLIGYHLRRASVYDLQGATAALEPVAGRPVPMSVLVCIIRSPGVSAAEICRSLGMQRANIVSILADLEERGFFLREADAADQRIQRLFPTREGEAAAIHWLSLVSEHERNMLRRLTTAEQTELRRLLSKIWQEDAPGAGEPQPR